MKTASRKLSQARPDTKSGPRFIFQAAFEEADAEQKLGGSPTYEQGSLGFMPDDATRDCARRMHYAAWRVSVALTGREAARWRRRYYDCRDRIVLGNRKLTFRAVHKWRPAVQFADDMAGDCQIVLIKAVAAYNPWLGIRFSTYVYTCLLRTVPAIAASSRGPTFPVPATGIALLQRALVRPARGAWRADQRATG